MRVIVGGSVSDPDPAGKVPNLQDTLRFRHVSGICFPYRGRVAAFLAVPLCVGALLLGLTFASYAFLAQEFGPMVRWAHYGVTTVAMTVLNFILNSRLTFASGASDWQTRFGSPASPASRPYSIISCSGWGTCGSACRISSSLPPMPFVSPSSPSRRIGSLRSILTRGVFSALGAVPIQASHGSRPIRGRGE